MSFLMSTLTIDRYKTQIHSQNHCLPFISNLCPINHLGRYLIAWILGDGVGVRGEEWLVRCVVQNTVTRVLNKNVRDRDSLERIFTSLCRMTGCWSRGRYLWMYPDSRTRKSSSVAPNWISNSFIICPGIRTYPLSSNNFLIAMMSGFNTLLFWSISRSSWFVWPFISDSWTTVSRMMLNTKTRINLRSNIELEEAELADVLTRLY